MARRTLWVVGTLALVFTLLGGGVALGRATKQANTEGPAPAADRAAADLLAPGRPWSVAVTGTEWRALIGGTPNRVAPRGGFLVVDFDLANAGETALAFPYAELALTDEAGRAYPADVEATRLLLLWERAIGLTDALAAGESRSAVVVFDVPPGAAGLTLIDAPGAGRVHSIPFER